MSKGLKQRVAIALLDLITKCELAEDDFDERAVEMLTSFTQDQGLFILKELQVSVFWASVKVVLVMKQSIRRI